MMEVDNANHRDVLAEMPDRASTTVVQMPVHGPDVAERARLWAQELVWLPGLKKSPDALQQAEKINRKLNQVLAAVDRRAASEAELSQDMLWLHDNARLVRAAQREVIEWAKSLPSTPHVRTPAKTTLPRVMAIAQDLLGAVGYHYSDHAFILYMEAFQTSTPLNMRDLSLLVPALKMALLEELTARSAKVLQDTEPSPEISVLIGSLRDLSEAPWKELLESLIAFDRILAGDPAAAYSRMDFPSRELYRHTVAHFAAHSDCSEMEIAQLTVDLAKQAKDHGERDPGLEWRKSHVGYYLIGEGANQLRARAGVRLPFGERLQDFLRRHPEEFYLGGIEFLTLLIVISIMTPVFGAFNTFYGRILAILVLLLPASQSAVEVMNSLTTALLHPRILPKLDFSADVPDDCVTMVVVPTLLLNEKQIHRLVEDLEVRYLGNRNRNLHFALLTDLADSTETPNEEDPLVDLCAALIRELNEKYAGENTGGFALFHRHRMYNPREGVWMGWERKRGKLLDFNRLIKGEYDSFPVKIGDLSVLSSVRFVLTLDSDTELPRGTAHRLVGAMAHPLNQAIIDPHDNLVVAGYGILQPRVGISVLSAARSRLANIYSGQTGFDIYARAVSDVYQDLNGEGIFTGKGIYDVRTLHQVLEHRFPRNSLLSHDLIEGAYARAGLVSDVEVIDDYPSHYSAYNRRKHRWLRGDWQIVTWLYGRVPDENGRQVRNPISFLSRWKILDNLRRSLVEPGIFLLFILGWTVLPGRPLYWTLVTIAILFVPLLFQFAFSAIWALLSAQLRPIADAFRALSAGTVSVWLTITFLAHQTLLSADAVLRTLYRRMISQQRLLEWETAAEAEMGTGKLTFVDMLLNFTPVVAVLAGTIVYLSHRHALLVALPILLLWAFSKPVALWLNRPPRAPHKHLRAKDTWFLRREAMYIWRYFATFSDHEHNWLIPDNVQEEPLKIAARISPTNLGLLLNARQVACEFGYLTTPEFVQQTMRTLETVTRLPRQHGHLFNWYDTRTLEALRPRFISTVDSGNLVASLLTLQNGCLDLLQRPLLNPALLDGYGDYLRILAERKVISRRTARSLLKCDQGSWLDHLFAAEEVPGPSEAGNKHAEGTPWFAAQTKNLVEQVRLAVSAYLPWLLPEFHSLSSNLALGLSAGADSVALARLPGYIDRLQIELQAAIAHETPLLPLAENLSNRLDESRVNCRRMIADLRRIASLCDQLVRAMDFAFLLDGRRKLLSIGYDVEAGRVHSSCYDLLASEASIASFVAIAKGDIPQESWFSLSRTHVAEHGRPVLISWTGTMFEYLMPALWMRSYPDTLLERTKQAAVEAQQAYGAEHRIPWGISESAYAKTDEEGTYAYRAFGVPQLALRQDEERLVVAPYATMLALDLAPTAAIENLHWMMKRGWFGAYGFYEAADFNSEARPSLWRRHVLVRCWMSHHQGMSLLALGNFLKGNLVQKWFHRDVRVHATELLLQERPVRHASAAPDKRRQKSLARKPAARKGKAVA